MWAGLTTPAKTGEIYRQSAVTCRNPCGGGDEATLEVGNLED